MDVDQRKYLIERIKQEYNNVVAPFTNKGQKARLEYFTPKEMEDALRAGDFSHVSTTSYNSYGASNFITVYFHPKTNTPPVDYKSIIEKLSAEKNKVLDSIMLGDIPNASEILANFIKFLSTEKDKLNGN